MTTDDQLAQADTELMRRLQRIRELEGENAYLAERVQVLTDADEKREWWREQYRELADRTRIEAEV